MLDKKDLSHQRKVIIEALDDIYTSLSKNNHIFKSKKNERKIFYLFRNVMLSDDFNGKFTGDNYDKIYRMAGLLHDDDSSFEFDTMKMDTNNSIDYITKVRHYTLVINYLLTAIEKKTSLSIVYGKLRSIAIVYRPSLAVLKYADLYGYKLAFFNEILHFLSRYSIAYLYKDKKNRKDYYFQIYIRLIAIDGIPHRCADCRLAFLTSSNIYLDRGVPFIRVAMKSKEKAKVMKSIAISMESYNILCAGVPKNTKLDDYFFPSYFQERYIKGSRKNKLIRRGMFESIIKMLCYKMPYNDMNPSTIDIDDFYKLLANHMEICGIPYICIANVRNIIKGAQLNPPNQPIRIWHPSLPHSSQYFLKLVDMFSMLDKKSNIRDNRAVISENIIKIKMLMPRNSILERNEIVIMDVLQDFIHDAEHAATTISTITGYPSIFSNRILPLFDKPFHKLKVNEWIEIGQAIVNDMSYSYSSRSQTKTLFFRIYNFLDFKKKVPKVNWKNHPLRIPRTNASGNIVFPDVFDDLVVGAPDEIKFALLMAFYAGLRCEEIFNLTSDNFEDEFVEIKVTKIKSSIRKVPINWLMPEGVYAIVMKLVSDAKSIGGMPVTYICNQNNVLSKPGGLSKRVSRYLKNKKCFKGSLHTFRHDFASWSFIRYYMLVDSEFRKDSLDGKLCDGFPSGHALFTTKSLADFALSIGGLKWKHDFINRGECFARPEDLTFISRFLGHVNRFTTVENYLNSLSWVHHYYLEKRIEIIKTDRRFSILE